MKICKNCGGKIIENDDQHWMIQSENGGEVPEGYCEELIYEHSCSESVE